MKLVFFEYTKNCEEFNTLVKATSEDASRRDLKQGQLLFESIYQNIILIDAQLCKIESVISCKNIEIIEESDEIKMFNHEMVLVEYSPDFERRIEISRYLHRYDNDHYIHHIYPSIRKVLKFLDSDFDHEKYKLLAIDWEKMKQEWKEDKTKSRYLNPYEFSSEFCTPIKRSIEIVLEYYSKQSFKLTEYIDLFSKNYPEILF